jgi:hypothetical protein
MNSCRHGAKVSEPRDTCHPAVRDERAKVAACGCLPFAVLVKRVTIELVLLWVYF